MALSINQTQLDSYNKSTSNGKGSLFKKQKKRKYYIGTLI